MTDFKIKDFNENDLKSCDQATKECFIACQKGEYLNENNKKILIPGIHNCLEKTEFYNDNY